MEAWVMRRLLLVLPLAACGVKQAPAGVEYVAAPASGEVAPLVKQALDDARREHRRVLVYVGATWCEPCRRFRRAVEEHKLDAAFPGLRLLEFDLDRDKERLATAGYVSRLIPLFARPADDGRASGRQMEGSIKGDGAVGEITPRLAELLQ
jgi:hypothetical protein